MAPYFAEHPSVVTTPAARNPRNTILKPAIPRRWGREQRIIDPEGDEDWALYGQVDLSAGTPADETRSSSVVATRKCRINCNETLSPP
jgi:Domain of unknown function (DUF3516)